MKRNPTSKGARPTAKVSAKGKGAKKATEARGKASPPAGKQVLKAVPTRAQREVPEGLSKKYVVKSTFNTHDIMHSPVEKTLKILDEILAGERLFTM